MLEGDVIKIVDMRNGATSISIGVNPIDILVQLPYFPRLMTIVNQGVVDIYVSPDEQKLLTAPTNGFRLPKNLGLSSIPISPYDKYFACTAAGNSDLGIVFIFDKRS